MGEVMRSRAFISRSLFVAVVAVLLSGLWGPGEPVVYAQCGTVNGDSAVDIDDATYTFQFLFLGGDVPQCGEEGGAAIDGFEPMPKNEQGYDEHRHKQTGIVFVRLPGGTFQMVRATTSLPRYERSPEFQRTRSRDPGFPVFGTLG